MLKQKKPKKYIPDRGSIPLGLDPKVKKEELTRAVLKEIDEEVKEVLYDINTRGIKAEDRG